ncbi:MAG TPA: CocE/NonD family hydrolase [Vicinamibacteria bacterium]
MTALALVLLAGAPFLEQDVGVRMRDGVTLRADVWRPAARGRFPTLVYRTPYDRKQAPASYTTIRRAVERGYAVVAQDVRGRHGSEGEFVPYANEGRDGYDTIEWAAAQPWSDGRVGTFGLSYPGAAQWLAALEAPPHLLAMVPAMTFSTARNFIYSGGVFDMSWTAWIWNTIAADVRARKGLPGPRADEAVEREWARLGPLVQRRLPISDLPEFREVAPFLFEWMRHPPGDPYWDFLEVRGRYGRVTAAVLNLSGWHDEAYGPEGAITNFRGLVAARAGAPPRARLLLGPWIHGSATMNARDGQVRAGDRAFGPAAAIDYDETILRFMDRHVRGLDNGLDGEKPVRVFVMGEDAWRDEDAWPPPSARPLVLHLHAGGALREAPAEAESAASTFVSDPQDPVADTYAPAPGAHDYRALAARKDLLVFETEPLAADLRVVGPLSAAIHLSADAPDADLWVKVFDVAPDGTAFNLMSPGLDVRRASYEGGGPARKPLVPGQVRSLAFDDMVTANLFRRGHRLRVVLAAAFFPHFSRNLHTGELETVSAVTRTAALTVHHDRRHPSRVTLSVVP